MQWLELGLCAPVVLGITALCAFRAIRLLSGRD